MPGVFRVLGLAVFFVMAASTISPAHAAMPPMNFTVNMSETVTVDTTGGTPRIAVDVGGVTRYASYTAGTGTSALTFTYTATAGDVDLDGVTVSSPVDLNGGSITDTAGNPLSNLTFTPPNTANVKVNFPSLSMDFVVDADGRYTLNGTAYDTLPAFLTATGGTFTRNSVGTYYDSSGVLQTATANTPRFDHDPVTHAPKGILIEESRTNLLTRSSEFDDGVWSKSSISVTANNAISPNGLMDAEKIIENFSNGHHMQNSYNAISGTTYTISAYFKDIDRTYAALGSNNFNNFSATFNLQSGVAFSPSGTTSIVYVGNGWYKCSLTFTATATATSFGLIGMNNSNNGLVQSYASSAKSIYVWGAQLEAGAFPTSYIPTTTAAVTRAADWLIMPTGTWLDASKGTLFTQSKTLYLGSNDYPSPASMDDGGSQNAIELRLAPSNIKNGTVLTGGNFQFSGNNGSYSLGATLNHAITYQESYAKLGSDGTLSSAGTSVNLPTLNTLRIGMSRDNTYPLNGNVSKVKYYPTRLSDTQLQLMTQ